MTHIYKILYKKFKLFYEIRFIISWPMYLFLPSSQVTTNKHQIYLNVNRMTASYIKVTITINHQIHWQHSGHYIVLNSELPKLSLASLRTLNNQQFYRKLVAFNYLLTSWPFVCDQGQWNRRETGQTSHWKTLQFTRQWEILDTCLACTCIRIVLTCLNNINTSLLDECGNHFEFRVT